MQDLLELLPDDLREMAPLIEPPPPSGLIPLEPSFAAVAMDVVLVDGIIVPIGGAPDKVLPALAPAPDEVPPPPPPPYPIARLPAPHSPPRSPLAARRSPPPPAGRQCRVLLAAGQAGAR